MAIAGTLTIVSGEFQDTIVNTAFPRTVTVLVRDTIGANLPGESVSFQLPISGAGGVFAGTGTRTCSATTGADGRASSQQIVANGTPGNWLGLAQATSDSSVLRGFNETNLPVTPIAYSISTVSGSVQKQAQFAPYAPFAVKVLDQYGAPLVGGTVTFTFPSAYGTLSGSTAVVTNASGIATSNIFTSNTKTGAFTVSAAGQGSPKPNPTVNTTWTTVDATIPTGLSIISGSNKQTPPSTSFPQALVARVTNGLGGPVAGISVTFTAPTLGASCTFVGTSKTEAVTTDASGNATSTIPKANATLGSYSVTVTSAGTNSPYFTLTNGLNYLPEVCTLQQAVTQADTSSLGTSGTDWSNPNRAWNGNTTGAQINTVSGVANDSLYVFQLPPAVLAAIDDQAKITRFGVWFDLRRTSNSYSMGVIVVGDYNLTRSLGTNPTYGAANAYQANAWSLDATQVGFQPQTGKQVKDGRYGIVFPVPQVSGAAPVFYVRNVQFAVCYQNPDFPPPVIEGVPLLLCEV